MVTTVTIAMTSSASTAVSNVGNSMDSNVNAAMGALNIALTLPGTEATTLKVVGVNGQNQTSEVTTAVEIDGAMMENAGELIVLLLMN